MIIESIELYSQSGKLRLQLRKRSVEQIIKLCQEANNLETGGILIGNYTEDQITAQVTEVTKPSTDSKSNLTTFVRGVEGLQKLLNFRWKQHRYYIGEWHYHPFASPNPSTIDLNQFAEFARDKKMHCPEPVLLIFGGNPFKEVTFTAQIVYANGEQAPLFPKHNSK